MMIHHLELPTAIDQQEAQRLYDTLMNVFDSSTHIELDASKVERIGTSGVQVLLAAGQHIKELGGTFQIKKCSDSFSSAFSDIGLITYLQEWGTK